MAALLAVISLAMWAIGLATGWFLRTPDAPPPPVIDRRGRARDPRTMQFVKRGQP